MKPLTVILIILVLLAIASVSSLIEWHLSTASSANDHLCSKYNIPAKSCARATAAGYYCPAWDAKGGISPQYCLSLK